MRSRCSCRWPRGVPRTEISRTRRRSAGPRVAGTRDRGPERHVGAGTERHSTDPPPCLAHVVHSLDSAALQAHAAEYAMCAHIRRYRRVQIKHSRVHLTRWHAGLYQNVMSSRSLRGVRCATVRALHPVEGNNNPSCQVAMGALCNTSSLERRPHGVFVSLPAVDPARS